jgi:hypothetical protein
MEKIIEMLLKGLEDLSSEKETIEHSYNMSIGHQRQLLIDIQVIDNKITEVQRAIEILQKANNETTGENKKTKRKGSNP